MHYSDGDKPLFESWQSEILKAASYAACTLHHPLYQLQADKTEINAYCLAFLDSLGGPKVTGVDSKRWTGRIGEEIHFYVRDNIRVMQVRVMVR